MIERVFVHVESGGHDVGTGDARFDDLARVANRRDNHRGLEIVIAIDARDFADEMRNLLAVRFFPADKDRHVGRAESRGLERLRGGEDEREIDANIFLA